LCGCPDPDQQPIQKLKAYSKGVPLNQPSSFGPTLLKLNIPKQTLEIVRKQRKKGGRISRKDTSKMQLRPKELLVTSSEETVKTFKRLPVSVTLVMVSFNKKMLLSIS
jgi:hypothetical protein